MLLRESQWATVKDTVLKIHFTGQNYAKNYSGSFPQPNEHIRSISNKVAVEKEVWNKDKVVYTYMCAIGNRRKYYFEKVNGKVRIIG